jgi:Sec-independent protein translocase protein TatA
MPLIRGHHSFDDHFTQIPNDWVRDSRLSLKAIGLLAQLMSHTPGWNLSIRSLARANGTGIDTIKSAVRELEQYGYLKRSEAQKQNTDGTFADYDWVTADPFQNPVTAESRHGRTEHKEEQDSKEEQLQKNNERTNAVLAQFDEFYKEYPRKIDRGDALKAFKSALKRTKFEDILAGAIRYDNIDLPEK